MRVKSLLFFVFVSMLLQAQKSKNIFLERSFWKSKPTLALVKQKIAEGNDPTQLNRHSFDAIAYGLLEKSDVVSDDIIKYLLTIKGNGVNKITHDGRTYIFWAAYTNRVDLMKYLVSKGAKTDIIDSHGYSVLNFAATAGQTNTKLYDYLISQGANPKIEKSKSGANALLLVIPSLKNLDLVDYFVSKGLKLTDTDYKGNGAVNYAAKKGNRTIIDLLIKRGLPFKELNKNGGNAMIMATQGGRRGYNSLEFFKYLEGLGVQANIRNKQGLTPLHNLGYSNKDIETIQYFIQKGTDVNSKNEEGNTALMNASSRNSLAVIKLLRKHTKDINEVNTKGQSALTRAMRNTPEVVKYLLEQNANVSVKDKKGNNLAYYLAQTYSSKKEGEFTSKIQLLKERGFDFTTPQKDGNTLLHIAADRGDVSLLKFLKAFNINVNAKNNEGVTALQKAVMVAKNPKIIEYLLTQGADKSVTTSFDETVLDLAKENEQLSKFDLSFLK
ncbi:ANK_REP_REGION domain-containing protein [Tenacibaculum sp. 190524A05c]|uniref:ankyrin repeat domain-containing protein n=1 Tax=Tenacibaculum platacis TaxID=3137852 RepID=UPI0031FA6024